jgi:hypothetical protein
MTAMATIEDRHTSAESLDAVRRDLSREVFETELALHDARQSGVDAWIKAAADHLHRAIAAYCAALP